MIKNKPASKSGQSLYEVVISLGVMTIIIVSLLSLAANTVKNASYSKRRTLASRLSQETQEWLRGERDKDWNDFYTNRAQPKTWCVISQPPSWEYPTRVGKCGKTDLVSNTNLIREITFVTVDENNIRATTRIYWEDKEGYKEIKTVTNYTNWRAI